MTAFLERFLFVGCVLLGLGVIVIAVWEMVLFGWPFVPAGLILAAVGAALICVSWEAFRDD